MAGHRKSTSEQSARAIVINYDGKRKRCGIIYSELPSFRRDGCLSRKAQVTCCPFLGLNHPKFLDQRMVEFLAYRLSSRPCDRLNCRLSAWS